MGLKQPACLVRLPACRASAPACRHAHNNYSPPPLPCSLQPIAWPVNVVVLIDGVEYPFTDEKAAQVATALQMITPAFKWTAAAQQVGRGRQLVGLLLMMKKKLHAGRQCRTVGGAAGAGSPHGAQAHGSMQGSALAAPYTAQPPAPMPCLPPRPCSRSTTVSCPTCRPRTARPPTPQPPPAPCKWCPCPAPQQVSQQCGRARQAAHSQEYNCGTVHRMIERLPVAKCRDQPSVLMFPFPTPTPPSCSCAGCTLPHRPHHHCTCGCDSTNCRAGCSCLPNSSHS